MCHGEAVFLGGAEHDQLPPPGDELVEFSLFFVDFGERPRFDLLSEAGNDGGRRTVRTALYMAALSGLRQS